MTPTAEKARSSWKGLIGGAPEVRIQHGPAGGPDHPLMVRPYFDPAERQRLESFIGGRPLAVEVGFGKGGFLVEFALANPEWAVVGLEVKTKLCYLALSRLEGAGVANARLILGDARIHLPALLPAASVELLFVLFPDPWWKSKHHKKRVLDPLHLRRLLPLLRVGGRLVVRSDVPMVLEQASAAVEAVGGMAAGSADPAWPETDREGRCRRQGLPFEQQVFVRTDEEGS